MITISRIKSQLSAKTNSAFKSAARSFLDKLDPHDHATLLTFTQTIDLIRGPGAPEEVKGFVDGLDGGGVLSVGSAIMAPQVFEKSLSCVNNLRLQDGRQIVQGHTIYVVDIQDGGNWDWSKGEPQKDNPAYYLRFCKSFSRMGGEMKYVQCDNVAFLHNLLNRLKAT